MADNLTINETATWPATVKLIDTDEPVIGGLDGVSNKQAITLANRSQWLKAQIDTVIETALLDPDPLDLWQLTEAIATLIAAALAASRPGFDVPFLAGWASNFTGEDLVEGQVVARVMVLRDTVLQDFLVDLGVAGTGAAVIWDVTVGGVTAFITKPQFADGSTVFVPGVFDPAMVDVPAGSIVEILVFQVGTVIRGQKATGGLKGREA
ncbi:MAG: hypothetical protein IH626_01860 [Rhodospirillales bacterium]|nr:hypothetical protein [Rhodospirillales bacterium]